MTSHFTVARSTAVSPQRLAGWIGRFRQRHGELTAEPSPDALVLRAADTATARLVNLWEPWQGSDTEGFIAHASRDRCFALLLVRKGADAVAVVQGTELIAHRVSRHHVQGRTKAGGWSQQRYARRRQNQADHAFQEAADDAFEVLVPHLADLTALVTGGDRTGVTTVLSDPRLAGLAALPARHRLLAVPEARLTVLAEAAVTARAVPIELDAAALAGPGDASKR